MFKVVEVGRIHLVEENGQQMYCMHGVQTDTDAPIPTDTRLREVLTCEAIMQVLGVRVGQLRHEIAADPTPKLAQEHNKAKVLVLSGSYEDIAKALSSLGSDYAAGQGPAQDNESDSNTVH